MYKQSKKVVFKPNINEFLIISFLKKDRSNGFAVLLKNGTFSRVTEGYVVHKKVLEQLKKAGIPFSRIPKKSLKEKRPSA